MQSLIKRFFQEASFFTITSISFLGATVSLLLSDLNPIYQFSMTSVILSVFIITITVFSKKENLNQFIVSISSSIVLINYPFSSSAAFFLVALIITVFKIPSRFIGAYHLVISSQLADAYTTALLLPTTTESNLIVRYFIDYLGIIPGLIVTKTLFIGLPSIYAAKSLEEELQKLFIKLTFLLGTSMAARNAIIFFGV